MMEKNEKLTMHTANVADANFNTLANLFPNAVTEAVDENGEVIRAIDAEVLAQEINTHVVSGKEERYQFTWPDKKKSVLLANAPIAATLRPSREESVNFDDTENLYIEGDNLDVLKLLRETYLNRVKMIYIDPPYNTGNDFIYEDDFAEETGIFLMRDGQYDEQGNRLSTNLNSNGRFHTDWLNMIYPRLRVARDLLKDDGVIFISIDDNEIENLKKICNEIFGEGNFVGQITWSKKRKGSFLSKGIISTTEYLLVYAKSPKFLGLFGGKPDASESQPIIKRTNRMSVLKVPEMTIHTKLADGIYEKGTYGDGVNPVELLDNVTVKDGIILNEFSIKAPFIWSQRMFDEQKSLGAKFIINTENFQIRVFKISGENDFKGLNSYVNGVEIKGTNEDAYEELERIFGIKKLFDYSKPVNLVASLVKAATNFEKNAIVLDFFSGSSTTAHSVIKLNTQDGGNRKFIMVQIPEPTEEKSEAYQAGYKNLCEIGKERIRRSGAKIKEEAGLTAQNLDVGFRVLKLDSSNMKEVYYTPEDYAQMGFDLEGFTDNVKADRNDEDLLFQVMLDLGIPLSAKINQKGKVFNVNDHYLIACFDTVDTAMITEIAQKQPYYAVFRDSSFMNDSALVNVEQIFNTYSPSTIRRVL